MASCFSHLSQLLDTDLAISITVKQGKGLLQAVDVAGSDLPVRADPEGGGPRHGQEVIRFGRRKAQYWAWVSTGPGLGCPLGPTRTGLGPADQLLLAATAENAASHPHSQRQAGYLSKNYPKPDSGNARNPFLVKCTKVFGNKFGLINLGIIPQLILQNICLQTNSRAVRT